MADIKRKLNHYDQYSVNNYSAPNNNLLSVTVNRTINL